ncbi:MAG: type II toxin-antitoxin system RatA family toxin [Rickettsia endosymbiont of Sergentomyia squamirostris]|uniref:Type II toxin-antitoxin system RatA family toxin n=1 Tax=Candidatus Tisiphia endosymbiont of Sergentomyia squamirostris TaxID=3113639 RepID=A0AAT9GAM1_9RICK
MPSFHQVKILPYNVQELFHLVLDVKSYPEFLPWCRAARIISESENQIIAELVIQLKGFSDNYQSRIIYSNDLNKQRYSIEVEAISGPFKYLKNLWQFSQEDTGSKIEFFIDFKMKFAIVDKLVNIFFTDATEKMVDAFEKRADTMLTKINLANYS